MLFIVLLFFLYTNYTVFAIPSCNPNRKIPYGPPTANNVDCEGNLGCWDDASKCYFSENFLKGFSVFEGRGASCSINETLAERSLQECANECLKLTYCTGFVHDPIMKYCEISKEICREQGKTTDSNAITYNKHASKHFVSVYHDCSENDIRYSSIVSAESCYNECLMDSKCKMMVTAYDEKLCYLKEDICDFSKLDRRRFHLLSCIPAPIFSDWFPTKNADKDEIIDNSNATCKNVTMEKQFNLKIPWPTVGREEKDFNLLIIGKNLNNCMNSSESMQNNTVVAFIVYEFHNLPQFTGNFKACDLISGNDDTFCKYRCSCGEEYCEAVHIRAFASNDANMSICNYQVE